MKSLSHAVVATLCLPVLVGCAQQKGMREHEKSQSTKMTWDSYIEFEFRGEVKESAVEMPLPYAEIIFVDTALDPHAAEHSWTTRVGTADSFGRVDQRFAYGWQFESTPDALGVEWPEDRLGSEEGAQFFELLEKAFDRIRAEGKFTVEFRSAGYHPVRLDVAVGDCARDGDAYIVELGTISMVRNGTDLPRDQADTRNDG